MSEALAHLQSEHMMMMMMMMIMMMMVMMMMMTMILMMKKMMMKHDDDINDEWFPFLVNAADNVAYKGRNAPTMDPALHHLCMFLIIIAVFPFFTPCAG